jgi:hypothetical protein
MNMHPHAQGIASILRTEIEAWRRANSIACISREAFAAMVMESHEALGGEAATGVEFSFVGDTYTQAKKAAQKLYRWLDTDGTLPAGIVPSILAALPLDVRLHCLNQMFRPLGIEARSLEATRPARFDGLAHAQAMIKENSEAQSAVVKAASAQTPDSIQHAIKEVSEAIEVDLAAKRSLEAALLEHAYQVEPASK